MTSNLAAPHWNALVEDVAERVTVTIEGLVEALEKSGYPPFTIPPEPDMRWMIYAMRPLEEWQMTARTDPERALGEIQDWANMARRRDQPEAAQMAAETVLAELVVEGAEEG